MPILLETSTMIYVLLGLIIVLIVWIIRLEIRLRNLLLGKDGKSLEDTIKTILGDIKDYENFKRESIQYWKNIENRLKRSIQAVETIRFNPFKGTGSGGNQSFSTTLLNEKGDGVVISSLYSREHISVFSKPIKKFSSEFEMTAEEKEVIKQAKENIVQGK